MKQQRKDDIDMNDTTYRNNKRKTNYLPGDEIYEEICRQNRIRAESQMKLSCRYRHNHHPYLILQPIKEEQIFNQPAIFLFHDIIRDKDIQRIKSVAICSLDQNA